MIDVYKIKTECEKHQTPGHFDRVKCRECIHYSNWGGYDDCKVAQALAFAVPLNWQFQFLDEQNENASTL